MSNQQNKANNNNNYNNKNNINNSNNSNTSSNNNTKNNSNSNSNKNTSSNNNNKQNALSNNSKHDIQERSQMDIAGSYEVITDHYMLILAITATFVILLVIFFMSKTFRVDRSISRMKIYTNYLQLTSLDYSIVGETRIGDYYVSSAYNACHPSYQMYDYTSENITLSILQSGARYLEFNVFNSEFGSKAYPVVSMGYKKGEWKMMINDTPLETVFETLANNAFKIFNGKEGVENYDDPLFIGLNLNTNSNLDCLNLIAFLITKLFGERLLSNTYSFQNNDNIADIVMNNLSGKIIFFSSDGFQGSGLEEIINYSWDNTTNNAKHSLQRLHYSKLIAPDFNKNALIEFNRSGFTIISPHIEGDFLNSNYNPITAFELGCQFICMEFQYIDSNMDYYITNFKNNSFVKKDDNLQKGNKNRIKTKTTTATTATTDTNKSIPRITSASTATKITGSTF